jgi:hypothetical protein
MATTADVAWIDVTSSGSSPPAQTRSFDRLVATLDGDGGMSPHFDVRVFLGNREITEVVRTEINAREDERALDLRSIR